LHICGVLRLANRWKDALRWKFMTDPLEAPVPKRPLFFAFSTLGCHQAGWEEAAALAKAHGFPGLELRALKGGVDLAAKLEETFGTPAAMQEAVAASGLRVASLDSSLRLLGPQEEHQREVAALASWADGLGVPYLRVFDGGAFGEGRYPGIRAALRQALGAWEELRRKEGFRCGLMIETHWALTDPEACARLGEESEAEGGTLNLLWDSCHTWNHAGAGLVEAWERLKPWVRHVHIKDAVRDPSSPKGIRYVLPGAGELSMPALLDALERDGFAGPVSLEWERMWNPELPPLDEALRAGARAGWW
jgi:sugar phosphate isomerase/epimerase